MPACMARIISLSRPCQRRARATDSRGSPPTVPSSVEALHVHTHRLPQLSDHHDVVALGGDVAVVDPEGRVLVGDGALLDHVHLVGGEIDRVDRQLPDARRRPCDDSSARSGRSVKSLTNMNGRPSSRAMSVTRRCVVVPASGSSSVVISPLADRCCSWRLSTMIAPPRSSASSIRLTAFIDGVTPSRVVAVATATSAVVGGVFHSLGAAFSATGSVVSAGRVDAVDAVVVGPRGGGEQGGGRAAGADRGVSRSRQPPSRPETEAANDHDRRCGHTDLAPPFALGGASQNRIEVG